MRKSTLFVSAALTTFILAVLVGAVAAYQNVLAASLTTQEAAAIAPVANTAPAATEAFISPEQAAGLAAQVIGRTDLYSVETVEFQGATAYMVTFSSGDLVYVSLDGQIVSIGQVAVTVVEQPSNHRNRNNKNNNNNNSDQEEDHDDEEHEDDD